MKDMSYTTALCRDFIDIVIVIIIESKKNLQHEIFELNGVSLENIINLKCKKNCKVHTSINSCVQIFVDNLKRIRSICARNFDIINSN